MSEKQNIFDTNDVNDIVFVKKFFEKYGDLLLDGSRNQKTASKVVKTKYLKRKLSLVVHGLLEKGGKITWGDLLIHLKSLKNKNGEPFYTYPPEADLRRTIKETIVSLDKELPFEFTNPSKKGYATTDSIFSLKKDIFVDNVSRSSLHLLKTKTPSSQSPQTTKPSPAPIPSKVKPNKPSQPSNQSPKMYGWANIEDIDLDDYVPPKEVVKEEEPVEYCKEKLRNVFPSDWFTYSKTWKEIEEIVRMKNQNIDEGKIKTGKRIALNPPLLQGRFGDPRWVEDKKHEHFRQIAILSRIPVSLIGPTGSGKSVMASYLAGKEWYIEIPFGCTASTELEKFIGIYDSTEDGGLIVTFQRLMNAIFMAEAITELKNNGKTVKANGNEINGVLFHFDEFNRMRTDVQSEFNHFLNDEDGYITVSTPSITVYRPKNLVIVTSGNPESYAAVQVMDNAVRDRLPVLEINYPSKKEELKRLKVSLQRQGVDVEKLNGEIDAVFEKVYGSVDNLRMASRGKDTLSTEYVPTLRALVQMFKMIFVGNMKIKYAFWSSIVGKYPIDERSQVKASIESAAKQWG